MGGSVLRTRPPWLGQMARLSHLNLLLHFPVAGSVFFETWSPVLKNKQKAVHPLVFLRMNTTGLSAWELGLFKDRSSEILWVHGWTTGSIVEGCFLNCGPGVPQHLTMPGMADVCRSSLWADPTSSCPCRVPGHPFWGTSLPRTSLFELLICSEKGLPSPGPCSMQGPTFGQV